MAASIDELLKLREDPTFKGMLTVSFAKAIYAAATTIDPVKDPKGATAVLKGVGYLVKSGEAKLQQDLDKLFPIVIGAPQIVENGAKTSPDDLDLIAIAILNLYINLVAGGGSL